MKKLVYLFLIISILLCSCQPQTAEAKSAAERIDAYYAAHTVAHWQDAAAIYTAGLNAIDYNIHPATLGDDISGIASRLLYQSFLKLSGGIESDVSADIAACLSAITENVTSLTLDELYLCALALCIADAEYDNTAAVNYFASLQLKDGGFPPESDYAISEPQSSARAIELVALWQDKLSTDCHDDLLLFTETLFNEEGLIENTSGTPDSVNTAITLRGLISAGIPIGGTIATATVNALDVRFLLNNSSGNMLGYKLTPDDTTVGSDTTAECLFAIACATYGSPWHRQ